MESITSAAYAHWPYGHLYQYGAPLNINQTIFIKLLSMVMVGLMFKKA